MCRLGGADEATARGLVGVPGDELRLLVGQELAGFGLATCLFLSLAADLPVFLGADKSQSAYTHKCACQRVACSSICTATNTVCTVTYTAMHTCHTDPVRVQSAHVVAFSVTVTWLRSGESPC